MVSKAINDKSNATALSPFTHLTSNLKTRIDTDLADLTFVVGPNRSFKSSLRQSIRLAIQRELTVDNKKTPLTAPNKLLKFAADKAQGIKVNLQSASGNLSYHLPINDETGKAKEAEPRHATHALATLTDTDFANAFPMDAVRALLFYDAKQARQALVKIFGAGATVDPPLGLSDLQKRMWADGIAMVTGRAGFDDTPVDGVDVNDAGTILAALSAWARTEKPKRTRLANSKEAGLAAIKTKATATGLETLPALEQQLATAKAWESGALYRKAREEHQTALAKFQDQLLAAQDTLIATEKTCRTAISGLEALLVQQNDSIEVYANKLDDLKRRLHYGTNLLADLDNRIASGKHLCPFNHPVPPGHLERDRQRIQAMTDKRQAEYKEVRASHDMVMFDKVTTETKLADTRNKMTTEQLVFANNPLKAQIEHFSERLLGLEAQLINTPKQYDGLPAKDLESRIANLKGAVDARLQYESGMREVRSLHESSAACKVVETEAQAILASILRQCKDTAEAKVNQLMPVGFKAELNLQDDECEWRVIGTDGQYHDSSASGSEIGSLIVALASSMPGRLKILDLDDRDLHAFDPENLQGLWVTIAQAVKTGALTQAIVVHNRPEEGPRRDDGWLILRRIAVVSSRTGDGIKASDKVNGLATMPIEIHDEDLMSSI